MELKKIEEAKAILKANGYFTDNLWNISDVQSKFKCTDEEAQKVLSAALTNEYIMTEINCSIVDNSDAMGFENIQEEEI